MNTIHYHVEENYITIFSSFSANFPPHSHTILAINCVHASNWFTQLQQTQQTDGQRDNSVLTVMCSRFSGTFYWLKQKLIHKQTQNLCFNIRFHLYIHDHVEDEPIGTLTCRVNTYVPPI